MSGTLTSGAREAGLLHAGASEPLTSFVPVLALTLLRERNGVKEMLCAVRRPESNPTHANVLSVPTMRVPASIARYWPESSVEGDSVPDLAYALENLLSRKLGLADALELDALEYRCGRFGAWQGASRIDIVNGRDVLEDLTMFNVVVRIVEGSELIPESTASYAPIIWTPVSTFLRSLDERDVSLVDSGLDQIDICSYGLCVETTRRMLES